MIVNILLTLFVVAVFVGLGAFMFKTSLDSVKEYKKSERFTFIIFAVLFFSVGIYFSILGVTLLIVMIAFGI